jgi:kynurenine formamidase
MFVPNAWANRHLRIVDLTLPMHPGMRGVEWDTTFTLERDGWNARTLRLYSHAGTHMDAPMHFDAGPETIDRIPLDRCMGYARVVHLPDTKPRSVIGVSDIGNVATTFLPGQILLLATGWSRHADDPARYRDALPALGTDLAHWCVERRVKLVGVEPPSVADVNDRAELTRIHRILLGAGIVIVEGLTHLDSLVGHEAWFVAAPLKIEGGDGCPCRAFAYVVESH